MRVLLTSAVAFLLSVLVTVLYLHQPSHVDAAPAPVALAIEAPAQIVPVVVHTVTFTAPVAAAPAVVEAPEPVAEPVPVAADPVPAVAPVAVAVPVAAKPVHVVKHHAKSRKHRKGRRKGHRKNHLTNWHHSKAPAKSAPADAPSTRSMFDNFFGASSGSGLVTIAERYIGSDPTGWTHVWCARFLNTVVLPQAGLRGTDDNRAISFARWGRATAPHPGVVAVFDHHVTLVVRVHGDGTFDGIGGNQTGHRVSVNRFPMSSVVAWRAPG
jgi:hypothetical protein